MAFRGGDKAGENSSQNASGDLGCGLDRNDVGKSELRGSDLDTAQFRHGRAPTCRARMLPARTIGRSIDGLEDCSVGDGGGPAASREVSAGRVSVRVAVPDRLIRMTEFGLRCVRDEDAGNPWWNRVADQMGSLVSEHLPQGAQSVEMAIDSESLEVVLEFDVPRLRLVGG